MKRKQKMGIFAIPAMVAMLTVVGLGGIPESSAENSYTYEVTVTNLTQGQPITPPLLATHAKDAGFFAVGEQASAQLQQLAENGNAEPLATMLAGNTGVADVIQGTTPLVPANDPGETGLSHSETFTITTDGNARYLSFASMLVCTNDGVAGIDSIKLPINSKTVYAAGYDIRTEMNTEDFADMVPPCQGAIGVLSSSDEDGTGESNPALAESGVIIPHPGITGGEDLLSDVHGWQNQAVKIQIERIVA
ncbi:MAG: spondin domain-containing protein [Nitrosopumilus sp.]